ncbi:CLUMA_CG003946, isoform A [Clunio marinus]|uniref:CLUMA_CG003946, isoform A n=1 Tax=Clunio marinus TaxID=568069 RepID=A0A1J1HVQ4_9DIPT|nr:CLUMA_CG003946, isoform A [Clunio marinus]
MQQHQQYEVSSDLPQSTNIKLLHHSTPNFQEIAELKNLRYRNLHAAINSPKTTFSNSHSMLFLLTPSTCKLNGNFLKSFRKNVFGKRTI